MKAGILAAGALAAALTVSGASAATLTATWNPNDPLGAFNNGSAFTVQFDDSLGVVSGVFEIAELTAFSGILIKSFSGDPGASFDLLNHTPEVPGVVVNSGLLGNFNWIFGRTGSGTFAPVSPNAFTYDIATGQVGTIPVPAALPLLLTGLAALGFFRRRKAA